MKKVLVFVLIVLLVGIPGISLSPASAQEKQRIAEGWHLIESLYMVPDADLDVNGGPIESWMTGVANGLLLDYWQDTGSQGDIILKHYRTDKGGTVFASVEWEILWESPPTYLAGGQAASIAVEHRVLEAKTWDPPRMSAAFDVSDMEIGYRSSSPNMLHKPGTRQNPYRDETTEVYGEKAVITTERPIATGKDGDRMALYVAFGDGYGMRYTYQWDVSLVGTASDTLIETDGELVPDGDAVIAEGWHLIESLYMVSDIDLDINGGPIESSMTGVADGRLLVLDYYQDSGIAGDVLLTHYRTDAGGTVFASVEWEILWENPLAYLPGGQPASITVEHRVLEAKAWEPPRLSVAFDVPDMAIGYRSSSPNILHKPGENQNPYRDTTAEVYGESAVMTTERPIAAGGEGDRMALYIAFGDGYGMRYTYRWGNEAADAPLVE